MAKAKKVTGKKVLGKKVKFKKFSVVKYSARIGILKEIKAKKDATQDNAKLIMSPFPLPPVEPPPQRIFTKKRS